MSGLSDYIAVIGAGALHFADALARYFADVLILPPFPLLDGRIASHPDTLLARVGGTVIVSEAYAAHAPREIAKIASHAPVRMGKTVLRSPYPQDVAYNVFQHGGQLYARTDSLDGEVTDAAREQGVLLRPVRQGYAGCSALSCEDVVLTADPSIASALEADGAAVVRLTPGGIRLPGYDYGFIGGAAGYCARTAVFFGNIDRHPDGTLIRTALNAHGIGTLSLGPDTLADYGGIFTISLENT
ncbi:MAG: hypothetical protein IJZ08_03340 [Clostridia bacterium]|nr:hypothetical protein [Clostridia bacterium]